MSLYDYARTRYESICAGEYCQACQTPTIVSSVGGESLNDPCECFRNRPKELLLLARISSLAPNSLVVVDPNGAPTISGGNNQVRSTVNTSARSEGDTGDKKRLKDMSHAVAKYALTKSGYDFGPAASERLERFDTPPSGTSFAEFSRSALQQMTTVFAEIEPKHVGKGDPLSYLETFEIDLIVQQLNSHPRSPSCRSYNSALLGAPYRPSASLREFHKTQALAEVDPDAQDFLPIQSALSARCTASDALSQMADGTSLSADEWL